MESPVLDVRVREALTVLCRVLLEDLDGLADVLTLRIIDGEDAYAERDVTIREDLQPTCRANLERVLHVLSGDLPPDARPASLTIRTGRRRARQGVPLEAMLRAYRLCGRLLWDRMRAASRDRFGGEYDQDLLEIANELWRVIDQSSVRLVTAYRAEEALVHGRDVGRRYAVMEGLLGGRGSDPVFAADAARILGLAEHGRFVCVRAAAPDPEADPLDTPRETLDAAGVVSVWHRRRSELVGLVAVTRPDTVATTVAALDREARGPVGVSPPVDGLGAAHRALRGARLAARTLPEGRAAVASLDDRLPEALLAESPEVAARLRQAALGGLLDLPTAERQVLLATLEAVLAVGGSPSHAAQALYCHRNTVMYRLAKIRTLTGRSTSEPRDRLILALGMLVR
ncbi:PucR family transcriptional regulator [Actinomycetospora atypica]|uniref:PucR family transcriptional regulator n=1 Tax=Actinomycetospora atypica TaxID=1290095 RepID=A0ABV9YJE5_9PSEU